MHARRSAAWPRALSATLRQERGLTAHRADLRDLNRELGAHIGGELDDQPPSRSILMGACRTVRKSVDSAVSVTSVNAWITCPVGSRSSAGSDSTPRARDRGAQHSACMRSNAGLPWRINARYVGTAHLVSRREHGDARHSTAYRQKARRDGKKERLQDGLPRHERARAPTHRSDQHSRERRAGH